MSNDQTSGEKALPDSLQTLSVGSAQTLVGKVFSRAARLLFQILLTRSLATSVYGVYVIGWTVFRLAKEIPVAGTARLVFRFGGEAYGEDDDAKLKGVLKIAVILSVSSGLIGAIFLSLAADWIAISVFNDRSSAAMIRWLAPSLPLFALFPVVTAGLRLFDQVNKYVLVDQFLRPIALIGTTAIAFFFGYQLSGVAFGIGSSAAITSIVGLYFLRQHLPFRWSSTTDTYDELQSYISFSGLSVVLGLSVLLLNSLDRLMLGYFLDPGTVGIYNVAATIGAVASLIMGVTNAIFPPIISRLYAQDQKEELRTVFRTQSYWVFALTLPGYAVFVIFGPELLNLFGTEYRRGYSLLLVVALGHVVNASTGSSGPLLNMVGFQHVEVVNLLIANTVNFALNFVLIQEYGPIGAAAATAASLGGMHLLKTVECYYLLDMFPITVLHLLVAVATAGLLGGYVLLQPIIVGGLLGKTVMLFFFLAVYLGLFFAVEYRKGRIQIFASLLPGGA